MSSINSRALHAKYLMRPHSTGLSRSYVRAWLEGWTSPFMTVTGNHTFWSRWNSPQETDGVLYARFLEQWGLPMPYSRDIGGVRFVGAGPTTAGATRSEASLTLDQVDELAAFLALAPATPTVLVLHSPLRHTVLDDAGPANSVYTSDDVGFSQVHTDALIRVTQPLG